MNVSGRKSHLASIGVTPQELYLIEAPTRGKPREEVTTPPRPTIPQQPRKKPETEGRKRWYYWFGDNNVGRAVTAIAAVGIATASTLPIFARNTPGVTNATPNPAATATMTVEDVYRSQVRDYLLQSVPDLASYQSALDYTVQRMVDMKTVRDQARSRGVDYGVTFEQVRAPITKWVQANIDWDKKRERLVAFSEEIDYIPDTFFLGNFTINENPKILTAQENPLVAALSFHVDEMIEAHADIWADLHDPAKMEKYLAVANHENHSFAATIDISAKYKNAITNHGTFSDKAHWALVGRALSSYIPGSNEELTRNEIAQGMILAAGGKAQIAQGFYVGRTLSGDRQLAVGISPELERYIRSRPDEFGTPLDTGYLQPLLPNQEAVERMQNLPSGYSLKFVFREGPANQFGLRNPVWLVGNPQEARKYGISF